MTVPAAGFYLERISVRGAGLPDADITFADGLNVIAGASDTGKSYLCSLIDFILGASRAKDISPGTKYERVVARLRERKSAALHEIERTLVGGDAIIRRLGPQDSVLDERTAPGRHSADDPTTLSAFLLSLSGFRPTMVRRTKKGETRSLSFRDVAFLIIVDEARIIGEYPPHISGSFVENTVEGEVLRLLVTGREATQPIAAPKKLPAQAAAAQLELVIQLVAQVEADLAKIDVDPKAAEVELASLDEVAADLIRGYEASRLELVEAERTLAQLARQLREFESKLVVNEGLSRRFGLLERHYQSDIERLSAVREAGVMLEALPIGPCPICGASPEQHRPTEVAAHYSLEEVRMAAERENEKVVTLLADLRSTLGELESEAVTFASRRAAIRAEMLESRGRVEEELQPRVRMSAEQIQAQTSRRELLSRVHHLNEQLIDLQDRAAQLAQMTKRSRRSASVPETRATADMEEFVQQVQEVLTAWHFPENGRVVFAEESQDLVIGGQPRASHGKGVRAITCSAFIAGLMKHCFEKGLPHPGVVVLDSPLVAYKDPDDPGAENARIRRAGVKDAFYRSLADGLCPGQTIILENEDPPSDVVGRITHHHFTKSETGRYGFFPVEKFSRER